MNVIEQLLAALQSYNGSSGQADQSRNGVVTPYDTVGMDALVNQVSQPGAGGSGGFMNSMVGTKDAPGWGGMAMGTAAGLANAFMAMKQYGIAKDTLAENKRQFGLNFDAQRQTTNTALEDRQRARVASNPGAYQSVGAYMAQNGIGG